MRVSSIRREARRLSCVVESRGERAELFLEFPQGDPPNFSTGGNWIVPALLLACMKQGKPLEMQVPISPVLLRNLETIQDIYRTWIPGYRNVQVIAPVREQPQGQNRTGLLFSGGVDSFYSLLKHQECVSDLIVLHGFEFPWNEEREFQEHLNSVRAVAVEFNKRVIIVHTNVREILVRYTHWDFSHGAALAAVGLSLESEIFKCLIASTCSYDQLHPWGSHPLLDPLWFTATLQFLHDGCSARRVDKLQAIADNKVAMKNLRACDNWGSSGNCGQCEKCLRTMVGLHVIGRLQDCPAMPHHIDPRMIRRLRLDAGSAVFFREFLQFPIEPPELKRAIHYALRNQRAQLRPKARWILGLRSGAGRIAHMGRLLKRIVSGAG